MNERPTQTDTDEPIGTEAPPSDDDVQGHGLLHESLHRQPATSRNAERVTDRGCRTPSRDPHSRRGDR